MGARPSDGRSFGQTILFRPLTPRLLCVPPPPASRPRPRHQVDRAGERGRRSNSSGGLWRNERPAATGGQNHGQLLQHTQQNLLPLHASAIFPLLVTMLLSPSWDI